MAQSQRIRVGIIGVGWGALVHAPAFRAVPEFELVALCSLNPERTAKAGARLGITDLSTDWKNFVKRDDLDLISIATPADLHVEIGLAALAAGKHILMEKPVAPDYAASLDLYQAAMESGLVSAVHHELRWLPDRLAIWEKVRTGFVGDLYFARITQSAGYWHSSHKPQSEWMYKRAEGGGYLMGLQSHDIDYIQALFGAQSGDPVAVCADLKTTQKQRTLTDGRTIDVDADDTGTLLMRLASGASVVISSSVVGVHTFSNTFDAFGSEGSISLFPDKTLWGGRVGDAGLSRIEPSRRHPRSGVVDTRNVAGLTINAMALMLEDWLPAFSGTPTPLIPSLREALIVQQVVDAAWASSSGAGWVELINP